MTMVLVPVEGHRLLGARTHRQTRCGGWHQSDEQSGSRADGAPHLTGCDPRAGIASSAGMVDWALEGRVELRRRLVLRDGLSLSG